LGAKLLQMAQSAKLLLEFERRRQSMKAPERALLTGPATVIMAPL
jgi:hypothetical protein